MKKISLMIILASIFLSACSGLRTDPPNNLNNACSIKKERKSWYKSMVRAERRWGVPVPVMMASIYQESKFTGTAKTPYQWKFKIIPMGRQSSAYGFAQALDGTWDEYRAETGNTFSRRSSFRNAADFIGWYMHKSYKRNGISKSDAYNQYLAYHEGHAGFRRGTYKRKKWLMKVAKSVQKRAVLYSSQLARCT